MQSIARLKWDTILADRGITYVAINKTSEIWAIRSAKSVKKHMPYMSITLFTDQIVHDNCFDYVVKIPSRSAYPVLRERNQYPDQGIIAKATYINHSPYARTIFLDMDTYVLDSLEDVFEALTYYDMAMVIDEGYVGLNDKLLPRCLPRFNTGMVGWVKNERTRAMFARFWIYFTEDDAKYTANEETPFALAVHESEVRVATLPPEYNCRFIYPYILRGFAKVLHGRSEQYEELAKNINNKGGVRVMHMDNVLARHEPGRGLVDVRSD